MCAWKLCFGSEARRNCMTSNRHSEKGRPGILWFQMGYEQSGKETKGKRRTRGTSVLEQAFVSVHEPQCFTIQLKIWRLIQRQQKESGTEQGSSGIKSWKIEHAQQCVVLWCDVCSRTKVVAKVGGGPSFHCAVRLHLAQHLNVLAQVTLNGERERS